MLTDPIDKGKGDRMKQKILGAWALFAVLLFSACEEMFVRDLTITQKKTEESAVAGNHSEQEEDAPVINEGNHINITVTTEGGQEIQGMEPFDVAVFNTQRAAWEADHRHQGWYSLDQDHDGPGMEGYRYGHEVVNDIPKNTGMVVNDIPDGRMLLPWGKDNPDPLRCTTISELYEKIDTLWTEQRNTGDPFLIQYDNERHYPKCIQIKNINDSGYDYRVVIWVSYEEDLIPFVIGGPWYDKEGNPILMTEEPVVAGNSSEQEEEPFDVNVVIGGYNTPTTSPTTDGGQDTQGKEPYAVAVFKTQRAMWEAVHPDRYTFWQQHRGPPELYLDIDIKVLNDIPYWPLNGLIFVKPDSLLHCTTISELYEKINTLWTEQRNTWDSFLIRYNEERHYPVRIQIKNINDSGYDYRVVILVTYEGDVYTVRIGGGKGLWAWYNQ
jgi:hypothetical protein